MSPTNEYKNGFPEDCLSVLHRLLGIEKGY